MKIENNGNVQFELKGKSLDAAKRLVAELERAVQKNQPLQSGRMDHIQESWAQFYDALTKRLSKEDPALLQATGLSSPVTQVFQGKQTLPRAYLAYPAIFGSPEKEPRYFMYAPVSHDGKYFTPEDAVVLTGKKAAAVDNLLFAGGWLGNAPLVSMRKTGVATPADYDPAQNDRLKKQFDYAGTRSQLCFIAGGESLAAVEDYRRREKEWRASLESVTGFVNALVKQQFPEMLKSLPDGEELRSGASYRYGGGLEGKTEILLSVRREGKDNIWNAGKTVRLLPNPAFNAIEAHGGEYTLTARDDTPEGRSFKMLLDSIPLTPALSDYPVLHGNFDFEQNQIEAALGINGVVPQARDLGGKTILIYNTDDAVQSSFTPKGATPLPTAAFQWLQSDDGDRNTGATPPPMPPEIAVLFPKVPAKKPAAKKPQH